MIESETDALNAVTDHNTDESHRDVVLKMQRLAIRPSEVVRLENGEDVKVDPPENPVGGQPKGTMPPQTDAEIRLYGHCEHVQDRVAIDYYEF